MIVINSTIGWQIAAKRGHATYRPDTTTIWRQWFCLLYFRSGNTYPCMSRYHKGGRGGGGGGRGRGAPHCHIISCRYDIYHQFNNSN